MIKPTVRFATLAGTLLLGAASVSQATVGDVTYIDGKTYEQSGIRWSDRLSRFETDAKACKASKGGCFNDALMIRNSSALDIKCVIRVAYPQSGKNAVANVDSTEIIRSNTERSVVQSLAVPATVTPETFNSSCSAVPDLPALDLPAECTLKMSGVNPWIFYPPRAIKRNEQGPVTVEITMADEYRQGKIVVVRSSEHPELDAAAIKLFKAAKLETNCPGKRFRKTVPFLLTE
jgi:TonB family protein